MVPSLSQDAFDTIPKHQGLRISDVRHLRIISIFIRSLSVSHAVTLHPLTIHISCRLTQCARLSDDAIDAITMHGGLRVLDISGVHKVTDECLVRMVRSCSALQALNLAGCILVCIPDSTCLCAHANCALHWRQSRALCRAYLFCRRTKCRDFWLITTIFLVRRFEYVYSITCAREKRKGHIPVWDLSVSFP